MKKSIKTLLPILFLFFAFNTSAQDTWEAAEQTNEPQKRHENAAVKVGDLFVVLGGRGIKTVDIFDTKTNTWKRGKKPPIEMSHFQAVSYHGLVYVMGGLNGSWPSETPLRHIYIYDPLLDLWTVGPEIPKDRLRGAAGVAVYQDKFYLVCGIINGHTSGWVSWLDEYDPATNTWRKLPDAPRARDHFQAAVVGDELVVTGGRKSGYMGQGFEATIAETDVYNFKTGEWRTLPSPSGDIPTQRAGCTAVVDGNKLIVIGGESGSQVEAHSEVEALDLAAGTWEKMPSLMKGRHGTQVILFEGNLYIAAGCGNRGGSPELNSFETYSLSDAAEEEMAYMPSTLGFSTDKLDFGIVMPYASKTFEIELSNAKGSQGILLTYLVATNPESYQVDFPFELPYLLKPSASVQVSIHFTPKSAEAAKGELLIKQADTGRKQPLMIELVGNGE